MLQAWWAKVEPKCSFKRVPLSGGWASPDVRGETKTSGDLVTTAKRFPFSVEVKRRENWSMATLAKGLPSPVWGWWDQCQVAAKEMRAEPMLWFRKSHEPWRVMLPELYVIARLNGMPHDLQWNPVDLLRVRVGLHPIVVMGDALLAEDANVFAEDREPVRGNIPFRRRRR